MPTNSEKYKHTNMLNADLEARIAADLHELSNRLLSEEKTKTIGSLLWKFMTQIREAYRTARLITESK